MSIKSTLKQLIENIKPMLMDSEESKSTEVDGENTEQKDSTSFPRKYSSKDILAALFNGMGVGLLLGMLLGLAVSPVVSAFIGTMSSLLVVLLGLNEKLFTVVKSVRIGAFGLFAVVGILMGFYIRSHSPLAPSLSDLKEEYISLGYEDSVANNILLYQEFNVIPKDWVGRMPVNTQVISSTDTTDAGEVNEKGSQSMMAQNVNVSKRNNVLFSSSVKLGDCRELETSNEEMSFEYVQFNFIGVGGTWKELAENINPDLPEEVKVKTLLLVRDVFCSNKGKETVTIKCTEFTTPPEKLSAKELKTSLRNDDKFWKQVIDKIDAQIDDTYHKKIYISLINTFCHD